MHNTHTTTTASALDAHEDANGVVLAFERDDTRPPCLVRLPSLAERLEHALAFPPFVGTSEPDAPAPVGQMELFGEVK